MNTGLTSNLLDIITPPFQLIMIINIENIQETKKKGKKKTQLQIVVQNLLVYQL